MECTGQILKSREGGDTFFTMNWWGKFCRQRNIFLLVQILAEKTRRSFKRLKKCLIACFLFSTVWVALIGNMISLQILLHLKYPGCFKTTIIIKALSAHIQKMRNAKHSSWGECNASKWKFQQLAHWGGSHLHDSTGEACKNMSSIWPLSRIWLSHSMLIGIWFPSGFPV